MVLEDESVDTPNAIFLCSFSLLVLWVVLQVSVFGVPCPLPNSVAVIFYGETMAQIMIESWLSIIIY